MIRQDGYYKVRCKNTGWQILYWSFDHWIYLSPMDGKVIEIDEHRIEREDDNE